MVLLFLLFSQPIDFCANSSCSLFIFLFVFAVCHISQHENLAIILCSSYLLIHSTQNKRVRRDLGSKTIIKVSCDQAETRPRTLYYAPHSAADGLPRTVQRSVKNFRNDRVPYSAADGLPRTVQHSVEKTTLLRSLVSTLSHNAFFRANSISFGMGQLVGLRGALVPYSCSPHRVKSVKRISRKLGFHWFLVVQ